MKYCNTSLRTTSNNFQRKRVTQYQRFMWITKQSIGANKLLAMTFIYYLYISIKSFHFKIYIPVQFYGLQEEERFTLSDPFYLNKNTMFFPFRYESMLRDRENG